MNRNLINARNSDNVSFISVAKIFLVAFCIGALAIILGVFLNSDLLTIGGPLVVMVSYILYVLKAGFKNVSIIVAGDSFYYLGFIFTLVSLISSLLMLAYNENVSIHNVIGSFGAALATTIVGLVARLCVTSFSVQANERRQKMEETLDRSISQFTMQLDKLNDHVLSSFTKINLTTQQQMNENVSLIANGVKELNDQIGAIKIKPDAITAPLKTSVDLIIDSLRENYHSNKKANDDFIKANLKATKELTHGVNLIENYVHNVDVAISEAVKRSADSYALSIAEIGKSIIHSADNLKEMRLDVEHCINNQFHLVQREIELVQHGLKALQKPINETVELFCSSQDQLADNMNKLNMHSREFEAAIKKSQIDDMNFSEINRDIVKLQATLKVLDKQLIQFGFSSGKAIDSLSQAALITENSTKQVAQDLSNVYQTLSGHLQRINKLG